MNHSEQLEKLSAALSKAQGEIKGAIKDSKNTFFKSSYADLASVWEACRVQLSSNGLSIVQSPEEAERGIAIETMLLHSSGQWISSKYVIPVSKLDAQAVGSAITYGRRYALSAMVGISPEDDDGNAAAKSRPEEKKADEKIELYSDADFLKNIPKWRELIKSGKKSAKDLILFISTKTKLTEEQIQEIKGWETENENA